MKVIYGEYIRVSRVNKCRNMGDITKTNCRSGDRELVS